jgi:hypothetical protein
MKCDLRDWVVILLVSAAWAAATTYLFKHPSDGNFVTWCGLALTITTAYHWLVYFDSKRPDAQGN